MYLRITIEEEEPKRIGRVDLRCAALYVSAALAVLTKGLIGLIFPGAIIFVHILITGNWKVLRRLQIGYGVVIFLIVAVPWHVAAALANPDFLWFYFIREHLLRYLGMRYPKDYDTVPRLLFWGLLLVWLFPWSAFIWGLVRDFPRSIRPREKTAQVCLFLFVWIGVILAFYAFSTTQEYYTFPALAAFALLLGKAMADLEAGQTSREVGPGRPCGDDGRRCCDGHGHDSPRMDRQPHGTAYTLRNSYHKPGILQPRFRSHTRPHLGNFPPPFPAGVSDRRHTDRRPSSRFFVRSPQTLDRLLRIPGRHDDRVVPFIQCRNDRLRAGALLQKPGSKLSNTITGRETRSS